MRDPSHCVAQPGDAAVTGVAMQAINSLLLPHRVMRERLNWQQKNPGTGW